MHTKKINLDGGAEVGDGLEVGGHAGGDVARNTNKLQIPALVVNGVHAGIRGELAGNRHGIGLRELGESANEPGE